MTQPKFPFCSVKIGKRDTAKTIIHKVIIGMRADMVNGEAIRECQQELSHHGLDRDTIIAIANKYVYVEV